MKMQEEAIRLKLIRNRIEVDERDIHELDVGSTGELAFATPFIPGLTNRINRMPEPKKMFSDSWHRVAQRHATLRAGVEAHKNIIGVNAGTFSKTRTAMNISG